MHTNIILENIVKIEILHVFVINLYFIEAIFYV